MYGKHIWNIILFFLEAQLLWERICRSLPRILTHCVTVFLFFSYRLQAFLGVLTMFLCKIYLRLMRLQSISHNVVTFSLHFGVYTQEYNFSQKNLQNTVYTGFWNITYRFYF